MYNFQSKNSIKFTDIIFNNFNVSEFSKFRMRVFEAFPIARLFLLARAPQLIQLAKISKFHIREYTFD